MSKTALITGGSSGLGLSFARILGKQGYNIIILARNIQRIDDALNELKELGISARGISCDVSQENQLREAFGKVKAEYGKIDFLIVNAGTVTTKLLSDYSSTEELKRDLDVDLWGCIMSCWFFNPMLVEGSKILMISSGFGLVGGAGYSMYCAAKAGIVNFAESLRRELLCKKINVYVACPGDMDSPQYYSEIAGQPEWMKTGSARKLMPLAKASQKILKQCKGSSKFLIITGPDVKLLAVLTRLLPRRLRDKLADSLLPRPKQA